MQRTPKGSDNWDNLRFFLAVARTGGLAGASRELGVNQSTVSRRIAALEQELGARLFDRQARGYALTAVGEQALPLAESVEDEMLSFSRTVMGADSELRGVVRVTTLDEVFTRIAPDIAAFRERYPGIDLELNTDLRTYSLTRREADVAIRPGMRPTEDEIVGRKLVGLPVAAYAAPVYLEGRKRPRRLTDLPRHTVIGFGSGHRMHGEFDELLGDAVHVSLRTNSMNGQMIAARAGLGVAVLPRFIGDHEPGLERLFAVSLAQTADLWLLIHADLRQTARVRAFVEFMSEAIQSKRELYEGRPRARRSGTRERGE